ncbi:MAG: hypothetical protein ACRD22_22015, partial [Terriglobia bacterium]
LPPNAGGGPATLSFSIQYNAAPTATLTVVASDVDSVNNFVATSTVSTNKQFDRVELTTGAALVAIALTSESAGLPLTVTCHRGS